MYTINTQARTFVNKTKKHGLTRNDQFIKAQQIVMYLEIPRGDNHWVGQNPYYISWYHLSFFFRVLLLLIEAIEL